MHNSKSNFIYFNEPYSSPLAIENMLDVLKNKHLHGDGPYTKIVSSKLKNISGGGYALLTPSCTHALEMASMLLNLSPGDEVIMPSFNFTSSATAVTKFGATPVFVDIDKDSKCIDLQQTLKAITPNTKAISWVNYAGLSPDLEELKNMAEDFNLILIEDNAHGLGGSYKGKPLGSFGDFAALSFHATKNIQCGEGGALIINNPKFIDRAEIIREKGTNRNKFTRGEINKYEWVDKGSSYLLAEPLAAYLNGQLESFSEIQNRRNEIWNKYYSTLKSNSNFSLQALSENNEKNTAHIFFIELESSAKNEYFYSRAKKLDAQITSHYQPLHNSAAGKIFGISNFEYKNTIKISNSIIRLPIHLHLTNPDIDRVIEIFSE